MAEQHSDFCPICGNKFDVNGTMAKCPVCGWTESVKALGKREKHMDADSEIAMYRFMSSADAFFSRKSYEEAYIGYGSVLDMDGSCTKAVFRRELTSQYLMMESSSVYLSCDSFFSKIKDIKAEIIEENDEKLSLMVFKDMLEYISARADYEKKYASVHKNEKTAASYLADTLLLYEHAAETISCLAAKKDVKNVKERAVLIVNGCGIGMKIRGMLLSGAEYVETQGKMEDISKEPSAKNVSRIKRMKLGQTDEMQVETLAGSMRKAKKDVLAEASPELYAELTAESDKTEKTVERNSAEEDKKRMEYEMWRSRNEKEYIAADKKILIFGIAQKAALVMAVLMAAVFIVELVVMNSFMGQLIAATVLFAAANVVFGVLEKSAEKKKGFYASVIDGDSARIRSKNSDFTE